MQFPDLDPDLKNLQFQINRFAETQTTLQGYRYVSTFKKYVKHMTLKV